MNDNLATAVADFLAHKRALGRKYQTEEATLRLLLAFADQHGVAEPATSSRPPARRVRRVPAQDSGRAASTTSSASLGCFLDWAVTQQRLQASPLRRTRRRETDRAAAVPVRHRPGPSAARGRRSAARQPEGDRPRADLPRHLRSLLRARAARRRGVRAAPRRRRRRPATARRAGRQVRQEPPCPARTAHRRTARPPGRPPTRSAARRARRTAVQLRRSAQRAPRHARARRSIDSSPSWPSRSPTASHRRVCTACVTPSPSGACCAGIGRVSTRRRGCYQLSTFMGHVDPTSTAVYLTITPAAARRGQPAIRGLRRTGVVAGDTMTGTAAARAARPLLLPRPPDHREGAAAGVGAQLPRHHPAAAVLRRRTTSGTKITKLDLDDLSFERVLGFLRYLEARPRTTTSAPATSAWPPCTPCSTTSPPANRRCSASASGWRPSR